MKIPQDMLPGTIHATNQNGDLVIQEYKKWNQITVKFIGTDYITTAEAGDIRKGVVKDKLIPVVYSVGYMGKGKHRAKINSLTTKVYSTWIGMLERCYCEKSRRNNPTYKDCTVDPLWHNFNIFAEWFADNYIEGYHLDKDKLVPGNRVYGPSTCCFLSGQENTEVSLSKHYKFLNPKGDVVEIFNLNKFCRENNLDTSHMVSVYNGKRELHKGWSKA